MTTPQPLLSIRNVSKRFASHLALDDVCLDIAGGEFISLLGPSGCGKTTLLRLIAGFMQADSGSISISGQEMTGLPPNRRPLNTVFQNYALFPHMSVVDNVAYGPRRAGRSKAEAYEAARDALRMVGLDALGSRMPRQLSGGQQQRVALARAIVNRPKLLLLDEPLSALDMQLRKRMQIELKQLQQQLGIAFIFVTHDQEEAMSMSDRIAVLSSGRIEQVGDGAQIYRAPANRFVAGFIGEASLVPVARNEEGVITLLPSGSPSAEAAVIRPEHIMLGDTAGADIRAEATVTAIVPIGGATSIHLNLAGNEIVARRLGLPDAGLRPGMRLSIGISSTDIHIVSGAA